MNQIFYSPVNNPLFDTLAFRVSPNNAVSLKDVAHMYAWCSVNSTRWNLRVDSSNNKLFEVTFAFDVELEALLFKLTWAFN